MAETVVIFGAGSIGRGFLADLVCSAGFEAVFVDLREELVAELQRRGCLPLRLVGPDRRETRLLGPVRAVPARDQEAVAAELERCVLAATAVGAAALPKLAPALARGVSRRASPLNVLICENGWQVSAPLWEAVRELNPDAASRLGLAECVVSRMVPLPEGEESADPLWVAAEDYARLPCDRAALVGPLPPIPGIEPVDSFAGEYGKKLYVHNLGHAAAAYHGWPRGCRFIHEAVALPAVREEVRGAMDETCRALARRYGLDPPALAAYAADLLRRFDNPDLRDTVLRVGRDPARKLGPTERLTGALRLCGEVGVDCPHVAAALAAAFRFAPPDDPSAAEVQTVLAREGPEAALARFTGLRPESAEGAAVLALLRPTGNGPTA